MDYLYKGTFFLQALPCVFAFGSICILWRRRHVEGVLCLILFECFASLWAISDSLEHAASSLSLKIFWSQFAITGASAIPVLFLIFTLAFTQNEKLINRKSVPVLFIIPVITVILAFTNQYHKLVWTSVDLISQGNQSIYHYGIWFWIYVSYEFGLVILSIGILLFNTLRFYDIYKKQILYLIIASTLPFIASVVYVFKLTPLTADLTPVMLIFSGIFIAIGIYNQGMFDVKPVVREQIVENLMDGVLVLDIRDNIIDVNPALMKLLGNGESSRGMSFSSIREKLFTEENYSELMEKSISEIVISNDTEKRTFEVAFNFVSDFNKKRTGKIYVFKDVTMRHKAMESVSESNNLLRKEIRENEKLIQDLDAYARSVAHDLKNPISGLIGMKDIMREGLMENRREEVLELLDMVHHQSLKMYKIVDDLLLLSRIRKEDIRPIPLDMPSIIYEAIKRLNGQFNRGNLSMEFPDMWPKVSGHPQWIEEVWFNLISNAVKYGGDPPKITISHERSNGFWRFSIQDNGDGLPPESLEKLFNDFERLDIKNKEGHGLGLSIIKRIIEKLGGEVRVTSQNLPGKGCIFSFTLRAEEEHPDMPADSNVKIFSEVF